MCIVWLDMKKRSRGEGEKAKGARAGGGVNTLEKHGLLFFFGQKKSPSGTGEELFRWRFSIKDG